MDNISPQKRSDVMRRVHDKDTAAEMIVRRLVHRMGYRYRLHNAKLPGKPDLVFASRRKIIFVHGCFWHGHEGCSRNRRPSSRQEYWLPKLDRNKRRDADNLVKLRRDNWEVLVVWECETKHLDDLRERVKTFLENGE